MSCDLYFSSLTEIILVLYVLLFSSIEHLFRKFLIGAIWSSLDCHKQRKVMTSFKPTVFLYPCPFSKQSQVIFLILLTIERNIYLLNYPQNVAGPAVLVKSGFLLGWLLGLVGGGFLPILIGVLRCVKTVTANPWLTSINFITVWQSF